MEDPSPVDERLRRMERRIQWLLTLAVIQTLLIVSIVVWYLAASMIPSTLTLVLVLVALALAGYLLRHRIPGWLGSLSRWFFRQMLTEQEPDAVKDSMK